MFIFNMRLPRRKRYWIIPLATVFVLLLIFFFCRKPASRSLCGSPELRTNNQRVTYIQKMGWKIRPEPIETLRLLLPKPLTEPYLSYNQLQKKQGFNLEDYRGKQITRYTYTITNYPHRPDGVQLNLYICKNTPVAGDVISIGEKGFRAGLAFPGEK